MNTRQIQDWITMGNKPGFCEVLPHREGEVADFKGLAVQLE
jgi:hypothetical protein